MKNKKNHKIIFYTILILCISAFSYFPKSYSKYIKEEEPATFYVGINKLYIGDLDLLTPRSTSTYKIVNYSVEFSRSNLMEENDTSQQIFVEVEQTACEITSVSSRGSSSINGNKATITYTSSGTDYISVNYKCNVNDIVVSENDEEVVYTNVYVYERFMPENVRYLYAKAEGVKMLLSEYYDRYPKPEAQISSDSKQLILNVDTDNKFTEFNLWINSYVNVVGSGYAEDITSYISSVYNSEEDILNLSNSLKGLTVTYDSENNNYIYQIDENFLGYARTYYSFAGPTDLIKVMFSNDSLTDDEVNEIFEYYLVTYSEYSTEDIDKIMQYVSNYGSVNYIMKPNEDGTYNEIKGLVYLTDTDEIRVLDTFLDYVNTFISQEISIAFDGKNSMFNVFINSLDFTYNFLTDDLINSLTNNFNIYSSIAKNNSTVTEKTEYSDYFVVQDTTTKKYILVNVYSDGVTNTNVKIIELGVADSLVVTQEEDGLNISITVDNQDSTVAKNNITEIMLNLDQYFGTNYKDEIVDELFVSSTTIGNITSVLDGTNITISYIISQ